MPDVACKVCKKIFYTKPFWLKNGGGKYCSLLCKYQSTRKGKVVKCFNCGKGVYRKPQQLDRSKSKKYFCSKSCQTVWRNNEYIGPKHANWKKGEYAYRSILNRHKVPKICRRCSTKDKRVLAVHHVDGDHSNNKLENLIWLCHNCHHLVHHHQEERHKLNMVAIV